MKVPKWPQEPIGTCPRPSGPLYLYTPVLYGGHKGTEEAGNLSRGLLGPSSGFDVPFVPLDVLTRFRYISACLCNYANQKGFPPPLLAQLKDLYGSSDSFEGWDTVDKHIAGIKGRPLKPVCDGLETLSRLARFKRRCTRVSLVDCLGGKGGMDICYWITVVNCRANICQRKTFTGCIY